MIDTDDLKSIHPKLTRTNADYNLCNFRINWDQGFGKYVVANDVFKSLEYNNLPRFGCLYDAIHFITDLPKWETI